jgi:release factor glutamine methyltransferase
VNVALTGVRARAVLAEAAARLAAAGVPAPRADAEWLLAGLLGISRGRLALLLDAPLDPAVRHRYECMLVRRLRREPVQHILGWEEFCGLRLEVTPAVLVPRPETESLVERALELLPPPTPGRRLRALDVGTGSGCIACALAAARPDLLVVATDISLPALEVARRNVAQLGLGDRVRLVGGDWLDALAPGLADLVVANPPYLARPELARLMPEVREYEPWIALEGGRDGLDHLRRLAARAPTVLREGGALAVETAGGAQAEVVRALFEAAGFPEVRVWPDHAGVPRVVTARRTPWPRG